MAGDFSNLTSPTTGADLGTWGTKLNAKLTDYDTNALNKSATASTQVVSSDLTLNGTIDGTAVSTTGGANKLLKSDGSENLTLTGGLTAGNNFKHNFTESGGGVYGYIWETSADTTQRGRIIVDSADSYRMDIQSDGQLRFLTGGETVNATLSSAGNLTITGDFDPTVTQTQDIGSSSLEWDNIYAVTVIESSDARLKTPITKLNDAEIKSAIEIADEIGTFQFLSSIEEKGEDARHHTGTTVQKIIEILEKNELNPFKYAFVCYDEWDAEIQPATEERVEKVPIMIEVETQAQFIVEENGKYINKTITETKELQKTEEVDLYNEDGEVIGKHTVPVFEEKLIPATEEKVIKEAGNKYSLRYAQLNQFLLAGLYSKFKTM